MPAISPLPRHARVRRLIGATTIGVLAGAGLAACGADGSGSGKPSVVVGFYPQQYLAEQIGGDHVEVTALAKPGAEPHDLELSAQGVAAVSQADLVIYQEGMQPSVDDAVANEEPEHSLDLLTTVDTINGEDGHDHDDHDHEHEDGEHEHEDGEDEHEHGDVDPHVWLDPKNMAAMGEAIAEQLAEIDPDNAADYQQNSEQLTASLGELDSQFQTELAQCQRQEFVTTHTAFGYLAAAYGLEQVALTGLSPEETPSPSALQEAQQFAEEHGVTTIFYETDGDPGYAETIADEIGATTEMLSPMEVAPDSGDYISEMLQNLSKLRTALSCQ